MFKIEKLSNATLRCYENMRLTEINDIYKYSLMAFEFSDGHLSAIVFE